MSTVPPSPEPAETGLPSEEPVSTPVDMPESASSEAEPAAEAVEKSETAAAPASPEVVESGDDLGGFTLPQRFRSVPRPKFDRRMLTDVIAGATFAAVNIPQSLGHGQIAGVNPVFGLFTLMFAMPVAAIFTSSVYMNVSTTSALAVAVASVLAEFPSQTPVTYTLIPLVLLIGLWQLLFGVFRLGFLVRFVSRAVMLGFMTGVAVLIILGQISDLTGYDSSFSNNVLAAIDTLLHPGQIELSSLLIGLLTMGLIVLLGRTPVRKFAMVIAIVTASALVQVLNLSSVVLVSSIAVLPDGIPHPVLPNFQELGVLLPASLAIAIVGLVQGAAISQTYINPNGKYPNVSRDFLGQGIANMAASVFTGIPAGGSASGSALIISAGQQTRLANVFAGLFVILGVLLLAPLIGLLAMPALAGLLIVVGLQLIDLSTIKAVVSTGAVTATALVVTFATTMVLPLQYAVFVGVGVSIMLNVFRQSNKVRVVEWRFGEDGGLDELAAPKTLKPDAVTALYIYGELSSGGASVVDAALPDLDTASRSVLIIGLRGREDIGSTFIQILERASSKLASRQSRLMLSGVSEHVYLQLTRTGALDKLGRENVFKAQTRLRGSLTEAMAAGQSWLAEQEVGQSASTSASAATGSPG